MSSLRPLAKYFRITLAQLIGDEPIDGLDCDEHGEPVQMTKNETVTFQVNKSNATLLADIDDLDEETASKVKQLVSDLRKGDIDKEKFLLSLALIKKDK